MDDQGASLHDILGYTTEQVKEGRKKFQPFLFQIDAVILLRPDCNTQKVRHLGGGGGGGGCRCLATSKVRHLPQLRDQHSMTKLLLPTSAVA
jgi:hypothetical protein